MHNTIALHPLTNARSYSQIQNGHPLGNSLSYIVGMTLHGVEYPFNQFRSPVPAMLLPSLVCIPPPLPPWHSMRPGKKKSLIKD